MGCLVPAQAIVAIAVSQLLAPPPPPDITRWCEDNIVFDERSPMPGSFRIDRFPFLREVHEVLSPEHLAREVSIMGSAQWGKTVSIINPVVGAWHEYGPVDSLVVHPTTSSATEWIDNKWLPMRRQAPSLLEVFGDGRSGDQRDAKFNQETLARNGSLKITSAGSPDDLAGTTRRLVVMDDVAKFEMHVKGDPEALATSRAAGFEDAKILRVSTPQILGTCRISRAFKRSDQRHFHVPCPHCGHFAPLRWENFKRSLDPQNLSAAHFTCDKCAGKIEHKHSAERDALSASYADQISAAQASADAARAQAEAAAQSASDRVNLYRSIVDALESAYNSRRVLTAIGQKVRLTDATAFLRGALASGGTSDLDRLEQALDAVADPSTALFKSFSDYQHDFNINTNLIERLKDVAGDTLTVEQRMLVAAENTVDLGSAQVSAIEAARDAALAASDQQLAALLGLDVSVLSITDAIAAFMGAQTAVGQTSGAVAPVPTEFEAGSFGANLDEIYRDLLGRGVQQAGLDFYGGLYASGFGLDQIRADVLGSEERSRYLASSIPAFAAGGFHSGGVRLVGERGPELEVTGPSRIYDSNQTRRMLRNDNSDVVAALARVEQRLQEVKSQNANLRQEMRDLRKINTKWDQFGMPDTRPAPTQKVNA